MKTQTQKPRFNVVSAFIAALGMQAMAAKKEASEDKTTMVSNDHAYGGLGKFGGAPIYSPKRTKFKGYMRDASYKAKRK